MSGSGGARSCPSLSKIKEFGHDFAASGAVDGLKVGFTHFGPLIKAGLAKYMGTRALDTVALGMVVQTNPTSIL